MGNQQSEINNLSNSTALYVNADVSFRTSNYSPMDNKVFYRVFIEKGSSSTDRNELVTSACDGVSHQAEQRRRFITPGSDIDNLINEGYTLVSMSPIGNHNFIIILVRGNQASHVGMKHARLQIVNAELKLDRLQGETLVVGSQKLVLSCSDQIERNGDELLEAISHETANGGRLIAAWPNGQTINGLAGRMDVVFQLPIQSANQNFAYQLSMTNTCLNTCEESNEDDQRKISHLSDDMHKALEAGWSLVDAVLVSPNLIIWFLEREVTDALVNEPSYEGRLMEVTLNMIDSENLVNSLNILGRTGWVLCSAIQISFNCPQNRFIAFFQRQVLRKDSSRMPCNLRSPLVDSSYAVESTQTTQRGDIFAPPVYSSSTNFSSYSEVRNSLDEDEFDLPHYEDIVSSKK